MEKLRIGITVGDINGIGLEVILKTLAHSSMTNLCTPVIYGSSKVVAYHKNIIENLEIQLHGIKTAEQIDDDKINVINCWQDNINIELGQVMDIGGKYAILSLEAAINDLKNGEIDAIVTAPIHKKAMQMAGFQYPGHTEYLTKELGKGHESIMLLINDTLRVGLATNHIPLADVAKTITKELLLKKLRILNDTLRIDFGIERPTIAVMALNPHAGDDGVIGNEEIKIIRPAVEEAKANGIFAMGPFPADGFYGSGQHHKFDGILAMYHDQGLAPFKALSFSSGVNYTGGLQYVRTSPDHGTGFDIAGQNQANPASFRQALYMAIDITRNRVQYMEDTANPLRARSKHMYMGEDEVIAE